MKHLDAIARFGTLLALLWIAWEIRELNDGITVDYFMDTISVDIHGD